MSRVSQIIEFEGYFAEGVLGIFKIIRGFADLRDLADVSVPYELSDGPEAGRVVGYQRKLNEKHALDIKKYLEQSDNRLIPEVILSVRGAFNNVTDQEKVIGVESEKGALIAISRRFGGKHQRIQQIRIQRSDLEVVKEQKQICRIDGNHRLAMAETLEEDEIVPSKYLAPFCLILLGPTENDADDYAESLIFHTINSTALTLESEHGLRLLLGQDPAHAMTPDNEFAYSPELHLTRLLCERLDNLPEPARQRFGERPLTSLWEAAWNLIQMDPAIAETRAALTNFADELFAALTDILTRLTARHPSLCQAYAFLELAARVWRESMGDTHNAKVNAAVSLLNRIGLWLGAEGITSLLNPVSPAKQLLETFKAAQQRVPKRVFLARWYPPQDAPYDGFIKANLRLQQLRETLAAIERDHGARLELIDMGTEEGGAFPIHHRMYEAIASSDIIICDLTGHRPNVFVEAGYALKHHEKNRLIFLFEPRNRNDKVPFDLTTFKYVTISEAAEIPNKVKSEIIAILRDAGAPL
ncbi:MAG: hypothetical protein H8D96_17865 [Desulfobacterales bacterium]|uniref:DGQHR domain-containing protein n=1 Tax=Candidatus Desulfatibia vada TaxID=2841696 RepID=A0A8J6P2L1_9BACT|nr:hypothetical protein [Candidatus Desulfatibia vada]MBL6972284.1 hypothetical protein [Desulfobacterales bacterium]